MPAGEASAFAVDDSPALNPESFTIEGWFYLDPEESQTGAIMAKEFNLDYFSYGLFASSEDKEVLFTISTSEREYFLWYETEPGDENWHHLAGSFDGRWMRLFYDGEFAGEQRTFGEISYDEGSLIIGSNDHISLGDFQLFGTIDEVRISNQPWIYQEINNENVILLTPNSIDILRVFPNPFNSFLYIEYAMPQGGIVKIAVYDMAGRVVDSFIQRQGSSGDRKISLFTGNLGAGKYIIELNSENGQAIGSAVFVK